MPLPVGEQWRWHYLRQQIEQAAVFGYLTDTIWGIGCHPWIPVAVERVLQIKHRPRDKGLILLGSTVEQFDGLIQVDAAQRQRLQTPQARPTTWLVNAANSCPAGLRGQHPKLAIRLTANRLIRKLCETLDCAVVSTSANRSGRQPARSKIVLQRQLGEDLDFLLQGPDPGYGLPSRIIELDSGRILRD